MLLCVAAIASLVAMFVAPVLSIQGTSMEPTLHDGDLAIAIKGGNLATGDVAAFYYNNKILVKRIIATAGQWVDIDRYGNVSVNGERIEEPYLQETALGTCDIALPYQVPEGRVFVMGDERATSLDSRSREIGCIATEQIVGRVALRAWPLAHVGTVS